MGDHVRRQGGAGQFLFALGGILHDEGWAFLPFAARSQRLPMMTKGSLRQSGRQLPNHKMRRGNSLTTRCGAGYKSLSVNLNPRDATLPAHINPLVVVPLLVMQRFLRFAYQSVSIDPPSRQKKLEPLSN